MSPPKYRFRDITVSGFCPGTVSCLMEVLLSPFENQRHFGAREMSNQDQESVDSLPYVSLRSAAVKIT